MNSQELKSVFQHKTVDFGVQHGWGQTSNFLPQGFDVEQPKQFVVGSITT